MDVNVLTDKWNREFFILTPNFRLFRHFLTLISKPLPQFLVAYFFAVH
jgi:hypothetical protein